MSRDVTEYDGIKYSLQPHGLRSRLLALMAFFVVSFGGALLAAVPAQADPGTITCFVEVTPDPTVTPTPTAPPVSPTPCPTAPAPVTVTTTVTVANPAVTVVQTEVQTVTVTETVTATPSPSTSPSPSASPSKVVVASSTAIPSRTPSTAVLSVPDSGGNSGLVGVGIGVAGIGALVLGGLVVSGISKRRRSTGRHQAESDTKVMPAVNDHDVSDYGPLGGYAGESLDDDTEQFPRMEGKG